MPYPGSINSITEKSDGPDQIIYAAHMNAIRTALLDTVTALGNAPQGNKVSVEERLDVLINDDGNLNPFSTTHFVGKSGCKYTTVQSAIDAAGAGDYIIIFDGVYIENLTISKSVKLFGFNFTAGSTSGVTVEGSITFSGSYGLYAFGVYFNCSSIAFSGECVFELYFCKFAGTSIAMTEGSQLNLYYSMCAVAISYTTYCLVSIQNSRTGALSSSDGSLEAYNAYISGTCAVSSATILWSRITGACTVNSGNKISFCRVASFAGSSGKGSYNVDNDHAPLAVP